MSSPISWEVETAVCDTAMTIDWDEPTDGIPRLDEADSMSSPASVTRSGDPVDSFALSSFEHDGLSPPLDDTVDTREGVLLETPCYPLLKVPRAH